MPPRIGDIVHLNDALGPGDGKFGIYVRLAPKNFLVTNTDDTGEFDCMPFQKKGRQFPRYDCYIACKNLFTAEDSQIGAKVGQLDDEELKTLSEKIKVSFYLTPYQIKEITAAIGLELKQRESEKSSSNRGNNK